MSKINLRTKQRSNNHMNELLKDNDIVTVDNMKVAKNEKQIKRFILYRKGRGKSDNDNNPVRPTPGLHQVKIDEDKLQRGGGGLLQFNINKLERAFNNAYKILNKLRKNERDDDITYLANMDITPTDSFEIVEDEDPNNEKSQKALDEIGRLQRMKQYKNPKFAEAVKEEEEAWNKSFDKALDKAISLGLRGRDKLNKSKGVNRMELELDQHEILDILTDLCKSDQITIEELQNSERDLQRGIPVSARIEELMLAKTGKKRKPLVDEEDVTDEELMKEDESDKTEYPEEDEIEFADRRKLKGERRKVAKRNYGNASEKSLVTDELTALCKSNQITLEQLTKAEGCVNFGFKFSEIPGDNDRVENLMKERLEFYDEDSNEDYEDDEMEKANLILDNLKTGKIEDFRTKRRDASRSDETVEGFDKYFGLSHVEIMDIAGDLHRLGEIELKDLMDTERNIQRGLEIPFRVLRKLKKEAGV